MELSEGHPLRRCTRVSREPRAEFCIEEVAVLAGPCCLSQHPLHVSAPPRKGWPCSDPTALACLVVGWSEVSLPEAQGQRVHQTGGEGDALLLPL